MMSPANIFVAFFLISNANGNVEEVEGDVYTSYEQCMVESEHEAKLMSPLPLTEADDAQLMFGEVKVECRQVVGPSGCVGGSCKLGGRHGR